MCCCLSVARLSELCMLLWTKHRDTHRDTHSWNHAGLMERLAWTPSPGTRGSCWVLWKTREAKPSRFLYNSYTLPLLCFILWRDSPKDIGPVTFELDPFKKRKKTEVEKEKVKKKQEIIKRILRWRVFLEFCLFGWEDKVPLV